MKKLTFEELVTNAFLSEKEQKKMSKLGEKDEAIMKLLEIHNAFQDVLLNRALNTIVKRIAFVEENIKTVEDWLSDGEMLKIPSGKDDQGETLYVEIDKKIGILMDKNNGMAERTRDMIKEISGISEDAMQIINAKRKLLGSDNVSESETTLQGISWVDKQADKKR